MRYTTPLFNENANLFGKFPQDRPFADPVSGIYVELYQSPNFGTAVPLLFSGCREISGSRAGGFATYYWPSSGITTPVTENTEYLLVMRDPLTTRTAEAKFVLGGHPDQSGLAQYEGQAHISSASNENAEALPTICSGTAPTMTFTASGIRRSTGSWVTDGFTAAIGNMLQVSGAGINRGITPELVSITTTTNPNDTLNFYPAEPFTPEAAVAGVTIHAKLFRFDAGTDRHPVLGVYDARQVAQTLGLDEYHIFGGASVTVDFNHDRWSFLGNDQSEDVVTFASGCSTVGARLDRLQVRGGLNGRILATDIILESTSGVEGVISSSALSNGVKLASGGEFVGDKVSSRNTLPGAIVDFSAGGACSFLAGSVQGIFTISGTSAGDTVGMSLAGTILTIHSSCVGGTIQAAGYGEFTYTPGSGPTFVDLVLRGSRVDTTITSRLAAASGALISAGLSGISGIADQVWDEALAGHLAAGSTGAKLAEIGSGVSAASGFGAPPTAAAIADQVWDEALAGHLSAGSTGLELSGKAEPGDSMALTGAATSGVADQVWDELLAGHLGVGSTGAALAAASGNTAPTAGAVADAVWDELLAGHTTPGSAGDTLANVSGSVATPATIADAVWDEVALDHVTPGTTGRDQLDARRHITNAREIDRTTSPWEEVVYDDDGVTEIQRATLSGGDATVGAITNTNRPTGVIVTKRDPV